MVGRVLLERKPARPAPPKRVDGQSRSGLDYLLAVVKHQQHLPPFPSVVATTAAEVTEITETSIRAVSIGERRYKTLFILWPWTLED